MPDNKIRVVITNKQKAVKIPTGIRMLVRRCCNAVLKLEKFEGPAEISVTFVDNAQIKELNKQYRYRFHKSLLWNLHKNEVRYDSPEFPEKLLKY